MLAKLDLPGIVHRFLADPAAAHPAAVAPGGHVAAAARHGRGRRARRVLARIVPRIARRAGAGQVVARALHSLVEGGRHQEVFGFILGQMKTTLAGREERAAPRDRGAGPRTGRPAGRLGARRLDRAPRARRWSTPNWTR